MQTMTPAATIRGKKRVGRPRQSPCPGPVHEGRHCRACARTWSRRYRTRRAAAVVPPSAQGPVRVPPVALWTEPAFCVAIAAALYRRRYVSAYAAAHTALRRATIAPALHCDHCGLHVDAIRLRLRGDQQPLVFRIPDVDQPRALIWLCPPCISIANSDGIDVVGRWTWPGYERPRRGKKKLSYDMTAHALALDAARKEPVERQARAYVSRYLDAIASRDRWIADGLVAGKRWEPADAATFGSAGAASLNRVWRSFIVSWRDGRVRARALGTAREMSEEEGARVSIGPVQRSTPAERLRQPSEVARPAIAVARRSVVDDGALLARAEDAARKADSVLAAVDAALRSLEATRRAPQRNQREAEVEDCESDA